MITPSFSPTATERVLPKLALDFTTANLDPRVTFTRTTDATHPATYINSSGYVTLATDNQPRFDYDPVTLACKGLLIEESRTNSFTYSNDLRNTAQAGVTRPWTYSGTISVAANAATGPDNVAGSACQVTSTGNSSVYASVSLTSGTSYAITCWIKAVTPGSKNKVRFLLDNGSTGNISGDYTATDKWTKVGFVGVASTTGSRLNGLTRPNGNLDYDVYVWGMQIETGSFATSTIPTSGAALTRNADVATMTGYGVVNQGTFVVDATVVNGKTLITSGSVTFAATASTAQKTAVAYDVTSVRKSINSGTITSSAGATASVDISIGPNSDGFFRKMFFYLPKLTDSELQSFSK